MLVSQLSFFCIIFTFPSETMDRCLNILAKKIVIMPELLGYYYVTYEHF